MKTPGMGGEPMLRVAVGRAASISRAGGGAGRGGDSVTTSSTTAAIRRPLSRGSRALRVTSPPPPPPGTATPPAPASPTFASRSPAAAVALWDSRALVDDGEEWEHVTAAGEEEVVGVGVEEEYRMVFGYPPTEKEVEVAVTSIQQIFENHFGLYPAAPDKETDPLAISGYSSKTETSTESESDWIEPAMHICNLSTVLPKEHQNVLDAFRLLRVNPSIQRMVISLSSDKAVWDAVMKNEVVQEFRRTFYEDAIGSLEENYSDGSTLSAAGVLQWILGNTKAKIMEFLDTIMKLVNKLFHAAEYIDEKASVYNDAVRTSFMLSIIVLIVVAVTRARQA